MAVLTDSIEDHDGVGHGVAHEGEEARHHGHVELVAKGGEQPEGHEDVVDEGHDAAHGEAGGEAEDHVDQDGQHGEADGGEGLARPLTGDAGAEALILEDAHGAQAIARAHGLLHSRRNILGNVLEALVEA